MIRPMPISHPFRLGVGGRVATTAPGSDAEAEDAIRVLIGSRPNERPMCWSFGIPDPTWSTLTADTLNAALELWGPDGVRVTRVDTRPRTETVQDVTVEYTRNTAGETDR